jgi:hypothetical protein
MMEASEYQSLSAEQVGLSPPGVRLFTWTMPAVINWYFNPWVVTPAPGVNRCMFDLFTLVSVSLRHTKNESPIRSWCRNFCMA